jgi:hypothetical protein
VPARSKVLQLPKEIRDDLDRRLVKGGFADYAALTAWLEKKGFEISKSSLHRYGQTFEQRCAALQKVTEQARAIVAENPDDDNAVNEALVRLAQEKAFTVLMEMQLDPDTVELPKLIRSIADIGRASVQQKKYQAEVRAKAEAAAATAVKIAKRGGLSKEGTEAIRAEILGIAKPQ